MRWEIKGERVSTLKHEEEKMGSTEEGRRQKGHEGEVLTHPRVEPQREREKGWAEAVFEGTTAETFPKLKKDIKLQTQDKHASQTILKTKPSNHA